MNVLIVEDEGLAVERLTKILSEIDANITIAGQLATVRETVEWLRRNPPPDIILMDIELADGQSFRIFSEVQVPAPVIFITSYDEHSIKAFKVNSIDYLLKPVRKDELRQSLQKYAQLKKQFNDRENRSFAQIEKLLDRFSEKKMDEFRQRFLVKTGNKYFSLETNEIAYFYFSDRLTYLKNWKGTAFVVDFSLDDLERMLDPNVFYRANRKYLVHLKSVKVLHDYFNHKLKLQLDPPPDDDVLVSKERAVDFKKWMGK